LGNVQHELRVADVASVLFEVTRPLHRLNETAERLLHLAALVHDVGRSVDDDDHPRLGARMLLCDPDLRLSRRTRRLLACLTLYHRGSVPEIGEEQFLGPRDDRREVRLILSLLRAADALDGRALESPKLLFALQDRRLQVHCYLEGECERAFRVYGRRKKFRLLEQLLDCEVAIEVHQTQTLRLVA
jgi:exopolyphosphatase/pppGpp-phosphohydrolase